MTPRLSTSPSLPSQPARPRGRLRPEPGVLPEPRGEACGTNPDYVGWLLDSSMLSDAATMAAQFTGLGSMWQNPYAQPNPGAATAAASVWFTAYPASFRTAPGVSYLRGLAEDALWQAFAQIGVQAVHIGPVKRAGGVEGWNHTPTIDGHFDRISTDIDPAFGTEDEFRVMCQAAAAHGGTVIDDIVPGHTGKGPDFRLAEMNVGDYPGIFHMVQIPQADWSLLPEVPAGADSINLDETTEAKLAEAGYIVGALQRVLFFEPGVKETNFSATAPVTGPDGVTRRWVYLHYFKQGQPSLNWLDPTFAAIRLVTGDALHSVSDLGSGGVRFDANGFLGVERRPGGPAWSEGHPLSIGANQLLASMVRKLGAFSFQELNLGMDDIAQMAAAGADLSYDFVSRPAYHHALATGDTEFLRLTMELGASHGIQPGGLIHALQNHDELTYELIHFSVNHADEPFRFRGQEVTGLELAETIRGDLRATLTGPQAPYNRIFTTNGIASTTASVVAACLGYSDLSRLTAEQVAAIQRGHLLLAMYNALQPGVFALSGWDLLGCLTLDPAALGDLLADGDTRWINRGAYDLLGAGAAGTTGSAEPEDPAALPAAPSLYGSLPEQLARPDSFATQLATMLRLRQELGLASATQLEVLPGSAPGLIAMVHQLPDGRTSVTALNFGSQAELATFTSEHLSAGHWQDLLAGPAAGLILGTGGSLSLQLPAHGGALLVPQ